MDNIQVDVELYQEIEVQVEPMNVIEVQVELMNKIEIQVEQLLVMPTELNLPDICLLYQLAKQ